MAELNFLVLGDWGGLPLYPYTTEIEEKTSKQMADVAARVNARFVVALGDNFYYDGVKNVEDARFKETYSEVFDEKSLQVPWYVIAGNHDHHGNVSAEIAFSSRSSVWTYPYYWHSKKFVIADTNKTLKLVLLDTIVLCGNAGSDDELLQPKGPEDKSFAEKQWVWLEEQLKYSQDDYLLVGGHFPVWSIAEHGPTDCLVDRLKPLLEKYKASSYICGHDHNLQHIKEQDSDVHYFVIGAANFVKDDVRHKHSVPDDSLKFYWADARRYGGFAHVNATADYLNVTLIDSLGNLLHSQMIKPRNGGGQL